MRAWWSMLFAGGLALAAAAGAARAPYDTVTVEPTRTSIYVGSVRLRMPPFTRKGDAYESTYVAKVRPYFFASESGTIRIEFEDEALRRLAAGETVEFTGEGRNEDGDLRPVTGRAVPTDARSGRIKVRVRVSPRIELIFNTTYRFAGDPATP